MRTSKESVGLLTGSIRGLSAAMRNMGIVVTAASAVSGAAMLTLSRRAERVNAAFREVNSISSEVEDSQEEYGDLVSRLNTEFGLQANRLDVIDGLYQSVSAGVDEGVEAQEEFLETSAKLAAVGLVDLETTVDVLSTAINAYGEETGFAEEAAASLFQTVQFGKVTLDELAPVMGRITALGAEMDVSIQELGASMAVLTRTGFEARVAATGLRAIIRGFMRPSEQMQEILRDIALDQDLFADSMGDSAEEVRGLAEDYREASEALQEFEDRQREVRDQTEEQSLAIQEARLVQEAIEKDRVDEVEDLVENEEFLTMTTDELADEIEDYRFEVNKLRTEETQLNQDIKETERLVEDTENQFSEAVGASGDLEGGLGQLVLENQGLVDTLVELRSRADEQGIAFDEMFPRTRALQGALALVGEDGSLLMDIFHDMADETFNAEDAWEKHEEILSENFDSMEEFIDASEEMESFDLDEEFDDIRGPQEEMRDATSQLAQAASDLGQIFNEEVTDSLTDFADAVTRFVDKIEGMEESVKENISEFMVMITVLGLLLGPLLLIGGQIALIASAMGTSFIPFFIIASGALGIFLNTLRDVLQGGEDAEGVFDTISSAIDRIRGFILDLRSAFTIVEPAIRTLGEVFLSLIGTVSDQMGDFMSDEEIDPLYDFALILRGIIFTVADFIEENEDLIASLIVLAVDTIINDVIPALLELGRGALAILEDIDWSKLIWIAGLMFDLAVALFPIIRGIGEWMQRNSDLIASLITWGAILGGVALGLVKLVVLIGTAATAISGIIATVQSFVIVLNMVLTVMGPLAIIKSTIISLVPSFAAGIAAIVKVLGVLVKGVMVVVGALSLKIIIIGAIIAAILGLFAAAWIARDEIVDAFTEIKDMVVEILETLWDFITGEISWKEAGEEIILSLVDGITGALGSLGDAASKVAETIGEYLPTSPADKGYFSDNPPEDIGAGISEGVADGMDLEDDIETEFGDLDDSELAESSLPNMEDMEYTPDSGDISSSDDPFGDFGGDMSEMGGRKVIVEEGAVKVGPFEGISDEELPEKVNEQVDRSLQDIVEEIEGAGRDSVARF